MKKYILHIVLAILSMAAPAVHAESSIFDDPVPKYEGHGPTKTVPLWPIYYYKIYTSKAAYRKHILWPIYTRTVTPEQKVHQFFSFQNKYPLSFSKHTYFFWPLSGFQSDPEFGYNDWIFPIMWQSKVKGMGRQNVIFPLYWYHKRDDGEAQTLNIALLNHNYWGPGYHNHLLLPIAWTKWGQKRDLNGYSHLLFPLFYVNRDEQVAEGKYGKTMSTRRERGFITLFYRWYHDKNAPEGLAQVNNLGIFPISFYKKENYLYYANGNIIRNKIFFLFPAFTSIRFFVVKPSTVPEDFHELGETPGTKILHREVDLYFPLFLRSYGYEITDAPYDLKNVEQIPTEHEYRWIFPYYSFYNRAPVRSLSAQEIPIADDEVRDIFMPSRIQGNLDNYVKRTSGIPLLYHNRRKTWTEGLSTKLLVDQHFVYLFPYVSRYAKNKDSEGRQSTVLLLAGWGNADLKIPNLPGYSNKYSYLLPLYFRSRRHSIGATPYSLDDRENTSLWILPYYRTTKRIGKSIGRTDALFPLAYHSDEEHARRNWWLGILFGSFERQIPLQSKYDSNKYPVTIYEDEDPLDYTRKVSFLLPFWYSKYNLNSAYWLLFPIFGQSHSLPKDETATHSMTIPLALANFKKSENADGSVERRDFAGAGLYYNSSYSTNETNETPQTSYWHAIPFYAKTVKPDHTRVTAAIPPISYDHKNRTENNGRVNDSLAIASPHRWIPLFKTYRQKIGLANADPDYLLSGHWLFPFYSFKTSMTFDESDESITDESITNESSAEKSNAEKSSAEKSGTETITEASIIDDRPVEFNDSDVSANDTKQDAEIVETTETAETTKIAETTETAETTKTAETTETAGTTETADTTETAERDIPQRQIKNHASKTTMGAGLVYYNNLTDGVRKQFILSGIIATKNQDPLKFGSNSAFFGLYGKENRSWKTKKRFSPFYSKIENEDTTSESSVLFGMFGTKETKTYRVSKIFFYPRVTPKVDLEELSEDEKLANARKLRQQHLEYARQYAAMNYPEQAAVEFLLADGEYDNDLQLMRLAADQFALLDPDKLERLLKNVPPQLLANTPAFSPDTFITYYPDEVFAKAADLYHKILVLIETEADSQPEAKTNNYLFKQDFNSTTLALALLCYKYGKFEQCFDILKQRYQKTDALSDGIDLLHFYADYVTHYQRLSRHKPHHLLTDELREKYPGNPLLEFLFAKKELSPFKDAYLEDIGIPLLLEVLELREENTLQSPKDRGQVLHLPPWPDPFSHVDPDGYPNFTEIMRATHNDLAICYLNKLKYVRPDVFGVVRLSSIFSPQSVYAKQIRKQQMSMTDAERKEKTAEFINNIMLHLSQGTDFERFKPVFETTVLYPCRRIQSQVLQALKQDYQTDLEYNHYEARKEQLIELDKILWQTSFDISFLRNWNATFVRGIPPDKGKGPIAVEADPNGFVDIDYAFDGIDHCTVEAETKFHNYFARKLTLHLGFDHTLSVELNGQRVYGPRSQHIARRDQDSVILDIPEGDITLKFIISDDSLNYGFFARFTDEKGMPFFFTDMHQLNCKLCGDQIENWTYAITPQLKIPEKNDAQ